MLFDSGSDSELSSSWLVILGPEISPSLGISSIDTFRFSGGDATSGSSSRSRGISFNVGGTLEGLVGGASFTVSSSFGIPIEFGGPVPFGSGDDSAGGDGEAASPLPEDEEEEELSDEDEEEDDEEEEEDDEEEDDDDDEEEDVDESSSSILARFTFFMDDFAGSFRSYFNCRFKQGDCRITAGVTLGRNTTCSSSCTTATNCFISCETGCSKKWAISPGLESNNKSIKSSIARPSNCVSCSNLALAMMRI